MQDQEGFAVVDWKADAVAACSSAKSTAGADWRGLACALFTTNEDPCTLLDTYLDAVGDVNVNGIAHVAMRRSPWIAQLTLLHVLVLRGTADGVRRLLLRGADPNCAAVYEQADPTGYVSPLICAMGESIDIVKLLLEFGADANKSVPPAGLFPLKFAVTHCGAEAAEYVTLLLQSGADPNKRDKFGMSALFFIEDPAQPELHCLLSAGADVSLRARNGLSARNVALMRGHSEYAAFLRLEQEKQREIKNCYRTMLLCRQVDGVSLGALPIELLWEVRKHLRAAVEYQPVREREDVVLRREKRFRTMRTRAHGRTAPGDNKYKTLSSLCYCHSQRMTIGGYCEICGGARGSLPFSGSAR